MERKNILTSQKEIVKNSWKGDFSKSEIDTFGYYGCISEETYCAFISLDYNTLARLGNVTYDISYLKEVKEGKEFFLLLCLTSINSAINDRLSVTFEDSEDWLGLFSTNQEEGKARWLPSNWKELITDEQLHDILQERNIQTIECLNDDDVPDEMKTHIAIDWCENNSCELKDYLSDDDKETIADDWIEENASTAFDKALGNMGDYETREAIKEAIDNL